MLYDFVCRKCGTKFDVQYTLAEYTNLKRLPKCPNCGSGDTSRRFTSSFELKGLGWYETDQYQVTDRELQRNRDADAFASEAAGGVVEDKI